MSHAEAVALITDSLFSVESVLANGGSTPLQKLERWSLKAAAHQAGNRIGSALRFPARNRHQQALLCQVALEDCAESLQRVGVLRAPQREDQPSHIRVVPGSCMPAQRVQSLD